MGWFGEVRATRGMLYVTLKPSSDLGPAVPDLRSGVLEYDDVKDDGSVKPRQLPLEVGLGSGGWQVRLPRRVVDRVVRLYFKDTHDNWWSVRAFFPNYTYQEISPGGPPPPIAQVRPPVGESVVLAASARELVPLAALSATTDVPRFDNYARPGGQQFGRQFYEWRIFVDEPKEVLERISEVEYVLHPTFPEPVQHVRDAGKQFELLGRGWGGFQVVITVRFKDGREAKATHMLDLSKAWPPPR